MRKRLLVGLLLLACPSLCAAQSSGAKQQPTPTSEQGDDKTKTFSLPPGHPPVPQAAQAMVNATVLPPGKGAWVVQVELGSRLGDLVLLLSEVGSWLEARQLHEIPFELDGRTYTLSPGRLERRHD